MDKIIVAAHKSYAFPTDDIYLPLFVGAKDKKDILNLDTIYIKDGKPCGETIMRDDVDENISEKNWGYSELTGLYWAWKNLGDADIIGLVHYRRYFTVKSKAFIRNHDKLRCVLTEGELNDLLSQFDILLPKKRVYAIETLYSHYAHTMNAYELDVAKDLVAKYYPEYEPYLKKAFDARFGYMFNMFVMRRGDLEEYCSFLFDILFKEEEILEKEGYLDGLTDFEKRLFGRVSEILFNAYVYKKFDEGKTFGEVNVFHTEPENWPKKGRAFLEAKFKKKKYKESF